MATSESKTKWNRDFGDNELPNSSDLFDIVLTYPGKKSAEDILGTSRAVTRLLWQSKNHNGSSSRLYYADNLPILARLLDDESICGKVRLVYIDPPFSTNGVFKSRSRNDAYHDLLRGSDFIEFIRQRLIILRELLSEDGSIYVHLDGNMLFHIKVVMDEVFGRGQFRNLITRRKCNPKNYTRNSYGNVSDYLLFYTKSDSYVWNRSYESWTDERLLKEYPYIEEGTGRCYKKVPIHAPGERNGATGQVWREMLPPPGKHWQYTPKTLDEMDARGEIYWSPTGNPRRKIYADQTVGVPVQDIWLDVRDAHNQNIKITGYPTEKPPEMLTRIIEASSNPGDLVLDCFAGSGTSLAEAERLNRRWIGVDNSYEALTTILARFRKGLQTMGDYVTKRRAIAYQQALPFSDEFSVQNFALYVTEAYQGELNDVVDEWQQQLG